MLCRNFAVSAQLGGRGPAQPQLQLQLLLRLFRVLAALDAMAPYNAVSLFSQQRLATTAWSARTSRVQEEKAHAARCAGAGRHRLSKVTTSISLLLLHYSLIGAC